MNTRGWTLLRVLLNRYHKGDMNSAIGILPQGEVEELSKITLDANDPKVMFTLHEDTLKQVHYSWLGAVLTKIDQPMHPLFLGALDEGTKSKLQKIMEAAEKSASLSRIARVFFQYQWLDLLGHPELLPINYLPNTSSINNLASWKKETLLDLIDVLSLFDLSQELPHVVDKNRLKKINESLTKKQRKFLKFILNQPPKWQVLPLGLDNGGWEKKKLYRILHKRGLTRLALSLKQADPLVNWYVVHILDTGRGQLIEKIQREEETQANLKGLQSEVNQAIKWLLEDIK